MPKAKRLLPKNRCQRTLATKYEIRIFVAQTIHSVVMPFVLFDNAKV